MPHLALGYPPGVSCGSLYHLLVLHLEGELLSPGCYCLILFAFSHIRGSEERLYRDLMSNFVYISLLPTTTSSTNNIFSLKIISEE